MFNMKFASNRVVVFAKKRKKKKYIFFKDISRPIIYIIYIYFYLDYPTTILRHCIVISSVITLYIQLRKDARRIN